MIDEGKPKLETLRKEAPEPLTFEEHIKGLDAVSRIDLREMAVRFLLYAYGGLLTTTMIIFFLQGFKLWGFQLDKELLQWLGAATVGEVGGLAAMVYGALFKKRRGE